MPGNISVVSPELSAEIQAMGARIAALEEALSECASPFCLPLKTDGALDAELIAREFNRRQQVAARAAGQPLSSDAKIGEYIGADGQTHPIVNL